MLNRTELAAIVAWAASYAFMFIEPRTTNERPQARQEHVRDADGGEVSDLERRAGQVPLAAFDCSGRLALSELPSVGGDALP